MSTYLEIQNVTLDIPIFDVSRSFRASLIGHLIGGKINKDNNSKKSIVNVRALDNISFRLESGDRLGLIGKNGAGKTSLLRLLAGVYLPLSGNIKCNSKITPLFNTSIGIDADDTGLENIFTMSMYLGMTKQEIKNKTQEIIDFSGLHDFINLPVRVYSAGMLLRLCFAIITALEPKILLMDEGIGAGDHEFAKKTENRLKTFYKNIDILVLASHSDQLIKDLCNKAVLLQNGKITAYGKVDEVLSLYYDSDRTKELVT